MRARRLPPAPGAPPSRGCDTFPTFPEDILVDGCNEVSLCVFQSRSRADVESDLSPRLSPAAIARGAEGVVGGKDFAEAGPSGKRLSPNCGVGSVYKSAWKTKLAHIPWYQWTDLCSHSRTYHDLFSVVQDLEVCRESLSLTIDDFCLHDGSPCVMSA